MSEFLDSKEFDWLCDPDEVLDNCDGLDQEIQRDYVYPDWVYEFFAERKHKNEPKESRRSPHGGAFVTSGGTVPTVDNKNSSALGGHPRRRGRVFDKNVLLLQLFGKTLQTP